MDPVRNPFAPGAGAPPPELAGRQPIIDHAETAIHRALQGRPARSQMLLGLRGVGKTVLLNRIETLAAEAGHLTSFIEAREKEPLARLIFPQAQQVARKLSLVEQARGAGVAAMAALRSFARTFKIEISEISISVDPQPGTADSGNLELDLPEIFLSIGTAAARAGKAWTILIDEVQYLSEPDLAALIVAIHRVNQRALPILFFGAGLPQVAALSGDAKSYAERLFEYPAVGALSPDAARAAIRQPLLDEGEDITPEALDRIVAETGRYPYFLQEWGFQAWNHADRSPIAVDDVAAAQAAALRRLDEGFFKVRFDRLTPKEREYVIAMARLGTGPYRSADVADALGETAQAVGPRRAAVIAKGMVYSPGHGDIAFTVPLFEDFIARHYL